MLELYESAGARRRRGGRVGAPVGRDERHLRVGAAGGARTPRSRCTPSTAGRSGVGTGFAALTAVDVLEAGGDGRGGGEAARARAEASRSLFYVDTLEYLRRGGRIGAAAALFGGALSVKPLLQIDDGKVATLEKVRTSARALSRLEELAVEAAGEAAGRRLRRAPGQPGPGRAARRATWPTGSRTTSAGARCGAPSWVRCWVRTWARACSRCASRRAPDRKPHAAASALLSVESAVVHSSRDGPFARAAACLRSSPCATVAPAPSTRRPSPGASPC